MRGSGPAARLAAVAVVVLSTLAIVSLAARSERASTVTPEITPTATVSRPPVTSAPYKQRETEPPGDTKDTSGAEMPDLLVVSSRSPSSRSAPRPPRCSRW